MPVSLLAIKVGTNLKAEKSTTVLSKNFGRSKSNSSSDNIIAYLIVSETNPALIVSLLASPNVTVST